MRASDPQVRQTGLLLVLALKRIWILERLGQQTVFSASSLLD